MPADLDSQPLLDRARAADKLTRELIAKIETEYLPKAQSLQRMVDPKADRPTGDLTVREGVRAVFTADAATDETWQDLRRHLESISSGLREIAHLD